MTSPSTSQRAGLFALASLVVCLLCAWLLFGRGTSPLQTDVLTLLPATERHPLAEDAVERLARASGDRMVLLVHDKDDDTAKDAARELGAALSPDPVFASVIAELPPAKRRMVQRLHESDEALRDKRVLVVDDDVRNIFALSSVLERHGMDVVTAGTGQEAIEKVAEDADIDLVLMDIMMPGMDGYETMQVIRAKPRFRRLPIVALTAKAMKGDREKCLEAGASDYLAKPVNTEQLFSALRLWLHR